jgi:glycosyltransferase involved in cell wall biosynthesis
MKLTIVIGTRQEAGNIETLVLRLSDALELLAVESWEVLFIDDSDDDIPAVVDRLTAQGHRLRLLRRPPLERHDGLSGALLEGFAATSADVIVVMDADLQHPPETVPALVQPILDGAADLVVGSRYLPGGDGSGLGGRWRRFLSRASGELVRVMFPETRGATDPGGNFFALHRSVIDGVELKPRGFKMLVDILVRGHATHLVEVPYRFVGRGEGESKFGPRVCLLFLRHLAKLHWDTQWRPQRTPRRIPVAPAPDQPLRLLMVASEAPPMVSGVARSVGRLAAMLRERGHDVELLSFVDYRRWSLGEFRISAFPLHALRLRRRLESFDAVVLHGPVPTLSESFLVSWRSLGRRRPPLVYTHHYSIEVAGAGPLCATYNATHERLAHIADQVVVTTDSYRRRLAGVGAAPVEVVPWGVDHDTFAAPSRGIRAGSLRVLYVGQLRPYKGVHHLVDAAAGVEGLEVTIAGGGPLDARLRARVAASGASNVRFAGTPGDDELPALFAAHDVVVLPSVNQLEAFGIALVEGMAAGCVPVASNLPGLSDVAGPTGMVVPVGDPAALRVALLSLAADPSRLQRLSQASALRARELSWDRTADEYERLLNHVVTARRIPAPTVVALSARPAAAPARPAAAPAGPAAAPARPAAAPARRPVPELAASCSIVVPAYNEQRRLESTLPPVAEWARIHGAELIVVDDASDDATFEMARSLLRNVPGTAMVRLPVHRGKGAAVRAGIAHASGERIAFMDADLATSVDDLPELLAALADAHVAIGSRAAPGAVVDDAGVMRTHGGRMFNRIVRSVVGLDLLDTQCGFKAFRAPAAKLLFELSVTDGFAFDVEILALAARIGYGVTEVPVHWRQVSGSHVRPIADPVEMVFDVVRTRRRWQDRARVLAAIAARGREGQGPDAIAHALRTYLPQYPVVPWQDGATALIPFTPPAGLHRLTALVQGALPALEVRSSAIDSAAILAPSADALRAALAAA